MINYSINCEGLSPKEISKMFSCDNEKEVDAGAIRVMSNFGYSDKSMADFFQKRGVIISERGIRELKKKLGIGA